MNGIDRAVDPRPFELILRDGYATFPIQPLLMPKRSDVPALSRREFKQLRQRMQTLRAIEESDSGAVVWHP